MTDWEPVLALFLLGIYLSVCIDALFHSHRREK